MLEHLSICCAYYRNPAMLREHHRVLSSYPSAIRERVTLIVGDDGSPEGDGAAEALEGRFKRLILELQLDIRVYRLLRHVPWGSKGARNTAVWEAPDGWCLVTDIDHVLMPNDAGRLFGKNLDPSCYYILGRRRADTGEEYHPHPNSYLLTRSLYWERVGGCNEDWDGFYGTDGPFRSRINSLAKRVEMPDVKLTVYNLGGEDIGGIEGAACRDYGRKGSRFHTRMNPELVAKIDRDRLTRPERPLRREYERVL